jgi:tetratricopeptide (TPR) repeat protein
VFFVAKKNVAMSSRILFAVLALAVIGAAALAWDWFTVVPVEDLATARFVGRAACAECHQTQHTSWLGSDHDRAMELASDASVLADFNNASFNNQGVTTRFFREGGKFLVNTEGPDGKHRDYVIKYTFGVRPLQQYMVEFPDGRVQVLRESWDVENKKWFFVTPPDVTNERIEPGDPLHWTGIAQNWNTTCADCHSTNVHKNYDPAQDRYQTSFAEIDVSCEECHGPGGVHVELARKWSPVWDRNVGYGLVSLKNKNTDVQLETCAKCHSRRYQVHEDFRPGHPLLDYYEPALLSAGLYHADGQILDEVYEYGSFVQSKMYANRVQCSDCHDPHSLKLKFTGNRLCAQCHVPAKYDTPAHHHHPVGSAGAQCVECHMPSRTYMVIDERRDHSFRVPRPDLSVELGTPNACNNCHTAEHESFQWAADAVRTWYGTRRPDEPRWASAIAAGRDAAPHGESLLTELIGRKQTPAIVRATAIGLLAGYPTNRSLKVRREAVLDPDPLVRLAGLRALSGNLDQSLVAELAGCLTDPIRGVRIAAAGRLAYLPLAYLDNSQRTPFERALTEFRKAQALSLDHAGGHLSLGALDLRHGRTKAALEHFQAAIRLEPYMAGPRAELANVLQQQNGDEVEIRQLRQKEAELLERDAGLVPENAEIQYQLGLLRYLLGDLDAAQIALSAACDRSPQNYEYLMALALLQERRYELSGESSHFEIAVKTLKKLNDLQSTDPRARQILLRLLATRDSREGSSSPTPPRLQLE